MKQKWLRLPNSLKGTLAGLASACFFAGYLVLNRYIYTRFKVDAVAYTLLFNAAGGLFAGLALLPRSARQKIGSLQRDLSWMVVLCALGLAGMFTLVVGQHYTSSIHASLLVTGSIISTMLFSGLFLHEHVSSRQKRWVIGMFVGLYIAIVGLHTMSLHFGDVLIIIGVLFFGLGNVLSRSLMQKHDARIIPDVRVFAVGVLAAAGYAMFYRSIPIFSLVGMWTLVSGLFFWLTMRMFATAVHLINANHAIVLVNAQIVPASFASIVLLGEHYSWEKFIGSAIVLISIYYITWKERV